MIKYTQRQLMMLRDEDALSRRFELALAAMIRDLLTNPVEALTADGASVFRSRSEPMLVNYGLSTAYNMVSHTLADVQDLSDLAERVQAIVRQQSDHLAQLISSRDSSDEDIYSRDITGDPSDDSWAESASHILTTAVREAVKESMASQLGLTHKRWLTKLDDKVRPSHSRLEGTVVPAADPFVVGKSLMQRPGDKSAPLNEWINCRCAALWFTPTPNAQP